MNPKINEQTEERRKQVLTETFNIPLTLPEINAVLYGLQEGYLRLRTRAEMSKGRNKKSHLENAEQINKIHHDKIAPLYQKIMNERMK